MAGHAGEASAPPAKLYLNMDGVTRQGQYVLYE